VEKISPTTAGGELASLSIRVGVLGEGGNGARRLGTVRSAAMATWAQCGH